MAIFRQESIIILVFIEFLQVFFSQARYTEFVYGPREHMDSGQVPPGETFLPWTRKTFERDRPVLRYNSNEQNQNRNEDPEELIENTQFLQENANENIESLTKFDWIDVANIKANMDNQYSSENSEDDEEYSNDPLIRVRRRIIPIGGGGAGKVRDMRRNHRTGQGSRSRNPFWDELPPPYLREEMSMGKRKGPTGSAALFSLYPELAPPDWRSRRGIKIRKLKPKQRKEAAALSNIEESQFKIDGNESPAKSERVKAPQKIHKLVPTTRRKVKLPKQLKEEIAVFAEQHGVSKAVTHFSAKLNLPIKPEMVEKFLVRYQTRVQRRANRS